VSEKRSSLCNLCVLCVSVVNRFAAKPHHRDTENTEIAQRNQRGKPVALLLVSSLMTSCSRAPSFDILGSYFPAWLICLALSVVLTGVVRWLLLRFQIGLVFPIVVYPSLTALFAFGMWLVFYG
jgi:YtcA family